MLKNNLDNILICDNISSQSNKPVEVNIFIEGSCLQHTVPPLYANLFR